MYNISQQVAAASGWWELITAITGGIIGALAGGVPAYLLALRSSKELLRRDHEQRLNVEKSQAFGVFGKISEVGNNLLSVAQQLDRSSASVSDDPSDRAPLQRKIPAMVGFSDEHLLRLSEGERSFLASTKQADYYLKVELLMRRHAATFAALDAHRIRRDKFQDFLVGCGLHTIDDTGEVSTAVENKDIPRVRLEESILETVIAPIFTNIVENRRLLVEVMQEFDGVVRTHFSSADVPVFDLQEMSKQHPNVFPELG